MKIISVMLPTYNEEANIKPLVEAIKDLFGNELKNYDYEIVISDNKSTDNTREIIRLICKEDKKVKAIFNMNNFPIGSGINGIRNTNGDCTIHMASDFQDPVEVIPKLVKKWEEGNKIVVACKKKSKESFLMYKVRSFYYNLMDSICFVKQINQFSGFALYDKTFINVIKELKDPLPYFRGLVSELGGNHAVVEYEQQVRRSGKSSYRSFKRLYDVAMRGITTYSKTPIRLAVSIGMIGISISFLLMVIIFILNIVNDIAIFNTGFMFIMILFVMFLQLSFIGIIGEYILNMNIRIMNHPIVVEEERINFE